MSNVTHTTKLPNASSEPSPLHMALAAGLCLAGASAFAQEAPTLSTVTVKESAVPALKVDRAPSAKFTAPLVDTPKTVTVIPEEVIKQTGATSLSDALKTTPGITFGAGEGGNPVGDRPFLRGSDAQNSLFVDGMRDIGARSREVFNVESVEVIKGSASAYAGRGGAGGSINLTTKKAQDEDFVTGDVGLGTDNYLRATVDVNRKLGDTTGLRVNALVHRADIPGRDGPDNQRWGIAPTVTFGMNTPTQVTLSYEHLQTDDTPDSGVPFAKGSNVSELATPTTIHPTTGGNRKNWYGLFARDFRKDKNDLFTASVEHKFSDTSKLRNATRLGKTVQDYVWTQPDDSQNNVDNNRVWRRFNSRYSETSTAQNVTEFSGRSAAGALKHEYVFGLELAREESDVDGYTMVDRNGRTIPNSNQCVPDGAPYMCTSLSHPHPHDPWTGRMVRNLAPTHYKTDTVSIYAFDTVTLTPQWLIYAGLRVDRYRTRQWDAANRFERDDTLFNYQLGAVYKLLPTASLYASIGSAATPGGAGNGQTPDAGIGTGGRAPVLNADALKPEKTRSIELGTKWELLDGQLSLNAALFRNDTSNARVRDPNTSLASLVGKKAVNGLELGFAGRITPQWEVFGGYTYMDSKQKNIGTLANGMPLAGTGEAFPNTPKHSASLWSSYKVTPKFTVGLGAVGQSDVVAAYAYGRDNVLIKKGNPGYVRYDAMATYQFNPTLALQVNLYNLTDKAYYASTYGNHYSTPGAGRSAVASFKYTF
jgi:catecholate siderophore receptor